MITPRRALFASVFALAASAPASAQDPRTLERDKPAYAAPVADEAHGLTGAERATALQVLRSHYQNYFDVFGALTLPGRDLKDFSKPASCVVPFAIDPAEFRKGSFEEGLPVRRAEPIVFVFYQQQVTGGQSLCAEKMLFTRETWQAVEDAGLELLLRNSGTTYCREDSDCFGLELVANPCGARRRLRVFGSNTTDPVFFVALPKFMNSLMFTTEVEVQGQIMQYGDRHPDHGMPMGRDVCPMKHWEEKSVAAVCVEHSCRARP